MEPERLFWKGHRLNYVAEESMLVSMLKYREHKDRIRCRKDEANLISSKTNIPGVHLPVLDLDFPHLYDAKKSIIRFPLNIPVGSVQRWRIYLLRTVWRHYIAAAEIEQLIIVLKLTAHNYVVSTSPNRAHLFIDVPMSWRHTVVLLTALRQAGIVEKGFLRWSIRRGSSFVRVPGVRKTAAEQLRSEGAPQYGMIRKIKPKS